MKNISHAPVTVVIPAYNEEDNVEACLQSLLSQKIQPAEIIFVNHNSKDKTFERAKKFQRFFAIKGTDLQVITEKTPGIANARNAGFNRASQPFIASMDCDCRPREDWVKSIEKAFHDFPKVDAFAGKIIFFDSNFLMKFLTEKGYYQWFYSWTHFWYGFHFLTTANCAVRKTAFVEAGTFNTEIISINGLDDVDLASRIFKNENILYNESMVVYASFRRYQKFSKMVKSMVERGKALKEIHRKYRENFFHSNGI